MISFPPCQITDRTCGFLLFSRTKEKVLYQIKFIMQSVVRVAVLCITNCFLSGTKPSVFCRTTVLVLRYYTRMYVRMYVCLYVRMYVCTYF